MISYQKFSDFTAARTNMTSDCQRRHCDWRTQLLLMALVFAPGSASALTLGSLFQDHMVLQQGVVVPVWGTAAPGATVRVAFAGQELGATADREGRWRVDLQPLTANATSRSLRIETEGSQRVINDVVVGEVWLCSGQSNMQMGVGSTDVRKIVAQVSRVRSFEVPRTVAYREQSECGGKWKTGPPTSAVATAFAHFLQQRADVPVGVVVACWGSSSIEAWMPRDLSSELPHYAAQLEAMDADTADRQRVETILTGKRPWPRKEDIFLRRHPLLPYNAMVHPLVPYAMRGVVWYQGERNAQALRHRPQNPWMQQNAGMLEYDEAIEAWIKRLRRAWGRQELQLLIVMLPGFGKTLSDGAEKSSTHPAALSWAWMRESQLKAAELSGVAVANTIDLGLLNNIHPPDKLAIGQRLARLAAREALQQEVVAWGPVVSHTEPNRDTITVYFDHAEGLTTTDKKPPSGFWLADETGEWVPAEAVIQGQTVMLQAERLANPQFVRYAFAGKPLVNLVNAAGLPAYPFRTDNFALITASRRHVRPK